MASSPWQAYRANALDRLIGVFSPATALRRIVDRTRLQRAYEAASPRDSWRPRRLGASAQADHMADATLLRGKARSLVQNVPYIATSLDALVANVIGTGITPRFTGPQADTLNQLWKAWVDVCDADGRLDFYGQLAVAYRAMEQDGEVLLRLRPRRIEDGLPAPLQTQLLEIDWLDSTRNTGRSGGGSDGAAPGNTIVEGIEYDGIGRVAAYWLWDQHPGDMTLLRGTRTFSRRIPAASIIHLFDPKRPGQARGITRLAPVIARTRDTQLLEDAHLARKNLEARLSVLVSGDASLLANEFQEGSTSATGAASATVARATGDLGELASGSITELPAGSAVEFIDPKATPGHVEDIKHHLHIITAALGVTYEMATGDMTEVNFSSARVRGLDVRRGFEHTQWMVIIPRYCRPIADAFVRAAKDAGKVPERLQYGVEYDCPKWDYINPEQEAAADALQIATGLSSLSAKLRARGENPSTVFAEIASDFATLQGLKVGEMSVLDILLFKETKKPVADANPAAAATAAAPAARAVEAVAEVMARIDGRLHGLEQRSTNVQVDNHVAPAAVSVPVELRAGDVNVAPAAVSIPVELRAGDTTVTVPERSVEVRTGDQHITVPERSVTVPVTVQAQRSREVTDIEHDAKGRIKRFTKTEKPD